MYVRVVNNDNVERSLTKGKIYKVLAVHNPDPDCPMDIRYLVKNNFEGERDYYAQRFEVILRRVK